MTEQIHVLINGEEYGPYSDAEFRQYLAEQKIISHDLVWTESLTQWVTAEEFLKKPKPEHRPTVLPKLPGPSDGRKATDLFYHGINLSLGHNGVVQDHPAAFRCFLQAAELGHAQAQLWVAREYRRNLYSIFQPSQQLAIHWFECAAAQGEAEAAKELDEVLEERAKALQERAEQREAVREFVKIAKKAYADELDAVFKLGECYFLGQGVSRDSEKAVALFRRAADKGHAAAQHALAMRFQYGDGVEPDLAEAAKWYRVAAQQGHAEAQSSLGNLLADGTGVPRDEAQAVKWYQEAANKGDEAAQFNLAGCYYDGRGVTKDLQEARRLWLAGADKGNTGAQNQLGVMCLRGEACPQDAREAASWFKKAADKSSPEAAFNLAGLLVKGRGVRRDVAEAARYYRLAAQDGDKQALRWLESLAESGFPFAQLNLGLLYAEDGFCSNALDEVERLLGGQPIERSDATAMKWIRAAAKAGFAEAQFQLALRYQFGESLGGKVPENPALAMKWLRRAAAQGHPEAQAKLGRSLIPTQHCKGDYLEAYKWLWLALEQGQDVKKDFDSLASEMEGEDIRQAQELAAEFEPVVEYSADEALTGEPDVQGAGKRTCGSGFFLTADGYFATNFHVVRNATSIHISTFPGTHQAELVATDEANDLAILKLDGEFSCLGIAASENVHLGEPVLTVGFVASSC
jgi:TPR repeat protein